MIKDVDIIKVHQTTKDFTAWYWQSISGLSKYIDGEDARLLMQYSVLEALNSFLVEDGGEPVWAKESTRELYGAIFKTLNDDEAANAVDQFTDKKSDYEDFMKKYRIDRGLRYKEMGSFWLKKVDSLYDDIEGTKSLVDVLLIPATWTFVYAYEYAYQYLIENPCNVRCDSKMQYPYCNYWELKELEHKLDTFPEGWESDDEAVYANREELLYALIDSGIFLPEAVKITKRIRSGKALKPEQKEKLAEHGFNGIDKLGQIRYLPSVSGTFTKVFRVNKLI